jgi:hypothetical protein
MKRIKLGLLDMMNIGHSEYENLEPKNYQEIIINENVLVNESKQTKLNKNLILKNMENCKEKIEKLENEEVVSLRGKLVKEIVMNFCEKSWYISFDKIEKLLQGQLNEHLKFQTKISNLKQKDNFSYGDISFKDENDVIRVINFTVISNNVIDNKSFSHKI